jgi:uncharacterized RDD family membrane protein YckC
MPIPGAGPFDWRGTPPDPLDHPEFYEGIVVRRIVAHVLDLLLIVLLVGVLGMFSLMLGFVTFGLLWIPFVILGPAITVCYDALQVGGPHAATVGMRTMGLEVRSWTGERPPLAQAFVRAMLFWGMSYMTATLLMWLVLGFALFNARRRCLHDFLSGTVVIRNRRVMVLSPAG